MVRRVVEQLGTPGVRLVSLTGLAGVGKTRIARTAAARVEDETERTVAWVDATQLLGTELFDAAVARAARIAGWDSTAADRLGAALDAAPRLVVLDGFDVDPADDEMHDRLTELVRDAPTTRFLLTARTPHRVPWGRLLRIEPLPTGDAAGELRSRPGVELFIDVSTSVGAAAPTDDDLLAIDAVVERLGGNPLAIRLAASRSTTFSPSTLLSLLDRPSPNPIFASGVLPDTSELRTSIDWGIAQLDQNQVSLLRDLTAFRGPIPVDAAEAVSDVEDCIGAVSQLVDVHLVDADHTGPLTTFSLPPIVREHVVSATDSQDRIDLRLRHQRWAVELATKETAAGTGEAHTATPGVRIVEADLLTALRRALEADDPAAAGVLVVALAPVWLSELTQDIHVDLVRRTARLLETGRAADELLALVHGWLALLLAERAVGPNSLDDVDVARLRALDLSRHLDPILRLRVLALAVRTGRAYVERGPLIECCDEAIQLASNQGAEDFLARFEIWGGMLAHQEGDLDRAGGLAQRARERGLHLDDASLTVTATAFLRTLPETTTCDLKLPSAAQIVASARACDEQRVLLWMLPPASLEALADGDLRAATEYDIEMLERARDAGVWVLAAVPTITQSKIAVHRGDLPGAARMHGIARNHMHILEAMLPPARLAGFRTDCDDVRTSLGAGAYDEAAAGGSLLSPSEATIEVLAHARQLLAHLEPSDSAGGVGRRDEEQRSPLTARELDVVELLVAGDSNKDIARHLGISPKTVMHHTSSIYRKLGVRGRAETVAWAMRQAA